MSSYDGPLPGSCEDDEPMQEVSAPAAQQAGKEPPARGPNGVALFPPLRLTNWWSILVFLGAFLGHALLTLWASKWAPGALAAYQEEAFGKLGCMRILSRGIIAGGPTALLALFLLLALFKCMNVLAIHALSIASLALEAVFAYWIFSNTKSYELLVISLLPIIFGVLSYLEALSYLKMGARVANASLTVLLANPAIVLPTFPTALLAVLYRILWTTTFAFFAWHTAYQAYKQAFDNLPNWMQLLGIVLSLTLMCYLERCFRLLTTAMVASVYCQDYFDRARPKEAARRYRSRTIGAIARTFAGLIGDLLVWPIINVLYIFILLAVHLLRSARARSLLSRSQLLRLYRAVLYGDSALEAAASARATPCIVATDLLSSQQAAMNVFANITNMIFHLVMVVFIVARDPGVLTGSGTVFVGMEAKVFCSQLLLMAAEALIITMVVSTPLTVLSDGCQAVIICATEAPELLASAHPQIGENLAWEKEGV